MFEHVAQIIEDEKPLIIDAFGTEALPVRRPLFCEFDIIFPCFLPPPIDRSNILFARRVLFAIDRFYAKSFVRALQVESDTGGVALLNRFAADFQIAKTVIDE